MRAKLASALMPSPQLSSSWIGSSTIVPDRLYRASFQRCPAGSAFGFSHRLLADVGIGVLERAGEVRGRGVAADVAIDAGAVDVERAGSVFLYAGVWVGWHRVP